MKKTIWIPLAVVMILIIFALGSPAIRDAFFPSSLLTVDGCIPPQFHSDYPRGSEIYITPPPEPQILPVGWQKISTIPNTLFVKEGGLVLVRKQPGYDELWIMAADASSTNLVAYIYRTDTGKWIPVPTPPNGPLYLDVSNNIWVVVASNDVHYGLNQLFRFDEQANQYLQVTDKTNELSKGDIGAIVSDSSGLLWFTMRTDPYHSDLFSFDPVTSEIKQHLAGNFDFYIAIDKNDNIYVIQVKDGQFSIENPPHYLLKKYNPSNGNTDTVEIPRAEGEGEYSTTMYIDQKNRLWISDNVWIDISESKISGQHSIPRSESFIHYVDFMARYVWERPFVMTQSTDGRVWYASTMGNAWFKPDTGEWCHFTSYGSYIVEDSNHNLWMMADNSLYELRMSP